MFFFFSRGGGKERDIFVSFFFLRGGGVSFFLKERGKYLYTDLFIFLLFSE